MSRMNILCISIPLPPSVGVIGLRTPIAFYQQITCYSGVHDNTESGPPRPAQVTAMHTLLLRES